MTALQCTSLLIDTLGKEKGQQSPPLAVEQYNKLLEKYNVGSIARGGATGSQFGQSKVRHKEQTREVLAVGACLSGPMAVMCRPLPRSLMCSLCTTALFVMGKKKRTHARSEHKEQARAAARSAVIEARLRHRLAFRTCQKEVAPNWARLWISEPPSGAEAAEYVSGAANDIATRTNGKGSRLRRVRNIWDELIRNDNMDCNLFNKGCNVWDPALTKQEAYPKNKSAWKHLKGVQK